MIEFDYRYDLYSQPFFTLPVDASHAVTVAVYPGQRVYGVSVKLSRCGSPGPLHISVGSAPGKNDIAGDSFEENLVPPLYEVFLTVPFGDACGAEILYITITSEGCLPLDGYRVYGPRQTAGDFDDAEVIPYWWQEEHSWGMLVPKHYRPGIWQPSGFSHVLAHHMYPDGEKLPSVSLRLQTRQGEQPEAQDPFEFTRELLGPKYGEWSLIYEVRAANPGEMMIMDGYTPVYRFSPCPQGDALDEELKAFFLRVFGYSSSETGNQTLVFELDDGVDAGGSEGHTVTASENVISIAAKTVAGLMRGLHYIEDVMLETRRPCLRIGCHTRGSLYETRMSSGIYPAPFNYFALKAPEIWSDGYIWRLARAGFNTIWFNVNLEDISEGSAIFPGQDDGTAGLSLERLRRITETAARYGVQVFIELRTGYYGLFGEEHYSQYPYLRTFRKWGNYPCMNTGVFRAYLEETLTGLFAKAPLLAGLMLIYDTEGYYNCFANNHQEDCPNCKGNTPRQLASVFFADLDRIIRSAKPDARVIAWTYYCDEDWNYSLLSELPRGVSVLSCFSQFVGFSRFGANNRTDDYACCVTGPGEYFSRVYGIAEKAGRPVFAKTEISQGQEFVSIPYVPALTQHQKRWDALRGYRLDGFMGDYIHCSFTPGPCTDLMRLNIFDTNIDGAEWQTSQQKLEWVASLRYGCGKNAALSAWAHFSKALTEHFPYSAGVCRYPGPLQAGPSQPFYIDSARPVKRRCARYNAPDLDWTNIYIYDESHPGGMKQANRDWNDKLVRRCFEAFNAEWALGLDILGKLSPGGDDGELLQLRQIAEAVLCMTRSMVNFIDFVNLREKHSREPDDGLRQALLDICLKERQNAAGATELCRANSRLGFSCEGQGAVRGGYFNLYTVQEKLEELEETILELSFK